MVPSPAAVSRWGALALLAGFCLVLLVNLLTGRIRLGGLLSGDRADGKRYFSYGRAQLLIVSLFAAGQYLLHVYQDPSKFPEISNAVVALFGGSAAVYTGEKAWALIFKQPRNATRREA